MIRKITNVVILLGILLFASCEKQSSNAILPATVRVELEQQMSSSITVSFVAAQETVSFRYGIGSADDLEAFSNGLVPGYGISDKDTTVTFTELEANTAHYIYTQGFDFYGVPGPILSAQVATLNQGGKGYVQYATETGVSINFKSNDEYYKLGYAIGAPGKMEEFKKGFLDETYIVESYDSYVRINNLVPDTEYVIYTKSLPRNSNGEPVYNETLFKTFAIGSCPKVDVSIDGMSVANGFFTLTPNEHVSSYAFLLQEKGSRDAILNNVNWRNNLQAVLETWQNVPSIGMISINSDEPSNLKFTFPNLAQNVSYEAWIICYDKDGNPAQCYQIDDILTPTYSFHRNWAKVEVTHEPFNVDDMSIEITFTPNQNTVAYMYEIIDDVYYKQITSKADYTAKSIAYDLYNKGYAKTIRLVTPDKPVVIGDASTSMLPFTYLYENGEGNDAFKYDTQYYIVACPLNCSGHASGWENVVIIPFTTPSK